MRGSQQNAGRRDQDHGRVREWLSRNRDDLARGVLAGLVVVALTTATGIVLGAGTPVVIIALVAVVAFAAGALIAMRAQQPLADPADPVAVGLPAALPELTGAEDVAKLTSYSDFFAPALDRLQMGQLDNVEAELLIRPGRLFEYWNTGSVYLAVFEPAAGRDREAFWRLPYVARISGSECREFEVPLKDSNLTQMQVRWEPRDGVMVASDLQEERWRKAGADFEAFAQAGFRMLRCFPFGTPSSEGKSRPCIVLLSKESKESGTFSGADDFYLMLLGALLSVHSLIAERARFLSEEGEASD
jgi:hypothetical protein